MKAAIRVSFTTYISFDDEQQELVKELMESGAYNSWEDAFKAEFNNMYPSISTSDIDVDILE